MTSDLKTFLWTQLLSVLRLFLTSNSPTPCLANTPLSHLGGCSWWGLAPTFFEVEPSKNYEPRLEQFLKAMERAEKARASSGNEKPLSCLMRESWATKRFWFNYAARKPFDVEVLFDSCMKEGGASIESLDEEARAGLEPFVEMKMKQLKAYDSECAN
jgi:hypothetical protein